MVEVMNKRKICVVITARPSYSRIKTAMMAINKHPKLELQLVIAGSALLDRYGNACSFIEADGFNIDEKIFMVIEGENPTSMAKTTGLGIIELSSAFDKLNPDIVVSIADRFETMATAIAASYMNIPLAHIQGGEVTGNIDEKVRHAITKLSDIHLVASSQAKERVVKMGEYEDTVFNCGCPSMDLAAEVLVNPTLDFDPFDIYKGVGEVLDLKKGYIVVLQHPVTTEFEKSRVHIQETLEAVKDLDIGVLWFWPNVDAGSDGTSKGIRAFREAKRPKNMHFFKNMEGKDFLKLLMNSHCLVGNSSTGIRECSFLGVPVVNIGGRQAGRDRGANVIDVDYKSEKIKSAIKSIIEKGQKYESDHLYGDGYAGEKIADILASVSPNVEKKLAY
jgi:UDP-N-acetylglucosamine 2-epimerase/N-acetylmannosamine kinase